MFWYQCCFISMCMFSVFLFSVFLFQHVEHNICPSLYNQTSKLKETFNVDSSVKDETTLRKRLFKKQWHMNFLCNSFFLGFLKNLFFWVFLRSLKHPNSSHVAAQGRRWIGWSCRRGRCFWKPWWGGQGLLHVLRYAESSAWVHFCTNGLENGLFQYIFQSFFWNGLQIDWN